MSVTKSILFSLGITISIIFYLVVMIILRVILVGILTLGILDFCSCGPRDKEAFIQSQQSQQYDTGVGSFYNGEKEQERETEQETEQETIDERYGLYPWERQALEDSRRK